MLTAPFCKESLSAVATFATRHDGSARQPYLYYNSAAKPRR